MQEDQNHRLLRHRREIGDRLRSLRVWRNLTQEALGNAMGVDRGTIIRIEAGNTSFLVDQAIKASFFLDVPLSWFFTDDRSGIDDPSHRGGAGGGEPPVGPP